MMSLIRRRLGLKLFVAFILVVIINAIVLTITIQFTAPTAFQRHMNGMGLGMGMGMNQGGMQDLSAEFRAGVNEALGFAALWSLIIAIGVSLAFSSRIVAPLQAMTVASRRIAEGKYDERVLEKGSDELGQLANSFNKMADNLEKVELMRRQLIGDVSHELRTPLTAIKGSMEGLMDGLIPANVETYQQIHADADRLSRLVDDLQELSRVEARAYQLDIRNVNLDSIMAATIKRLTPSARVKSISLESITSEDLPVVNADEDRLVQVLTNLISNAIQYTPEGGKVTVSAAQGNKEIQIRINDTGMGIPSEHLSNIFTRFYRVDKSRSRMSGGGSGIGLTIARLLVEAHGGRIWAESEGEGKGSSFVFTLPIK